MHKYQAGIHAVCVQTFASSCCRHCDMRTVCSQDIMDWVLRAAADILQTQQHAMLCAWAAARLSVSTLIAAMAKRCSSKVLHYQNDANSSNKLIVYAQDSKSRRAR